MKRTSLKRTSSLRRRRRPPVTLNEVDRVAWKTQQAGFCECCGRFSLSLERHHVVTLETIKREGRYDLAYDLRNAMSLHPVCHARHTNAVRRIPLETVPDNALAFAVDLLGEDRAALYIARFYGCERRAA